MQEAVRIRQAGPESRRLVGKSDSNSEGIVRPRQWEKIQGRKTNFFIVDRVDRERSRGFRGAVELDGTLQEAEFPEVVVLTARV